MTFLLPSLLASHAGFGFNLNPFETNIINLAIVIAGLWKFLPGFLGSILERRRAAILNDLQDAEQRLLAATSSLAQAQQDLSAAQQRLSRFALMVWPVPKLCGWKAKSARSMKWLGLSREPWPT